MPPPKCRNCHKNYMVPHPRFEATKKDYTKAMFTSTALVPRTLRAFFGYENVVMRQNSGEEKELQILFRLEGAAFEGQ